MNETFDEGIERLEAEAAGGSPAPTVDGGCLPLDDIYTSPELQPRGEQTGSFDSEKHIRGLIRSIKGKPDGILQSILVWWSGRRWYVVDGHHRLASYKQVEKGGKAKWGPNGVPVEVLEGGYSAARLACLGGNTQAKLEMTEVDRLDGAWKLTVDGIGSKREVMTSASVSDGTVKNMRRALMELRKRELDGNEIAALSWDEARRLADNLEMPANRSDEWVEKLAEEWKNRLRTTFGGALTKNPDIFAMAVRRYSPNFAERLVESLEFSDLVEKQVNERLYELGAGHLLDREEPDF